MAPFVQVSEFMNALDLLRSDHDQIDEMIDRFEASEERAEKRQIFTRLRSDIETHTHVEEVVFYPHFENREGFHDLISDFYDDHLEIRELVENLDAAFDEGNDMELEDKFDDLVSSIQSHVDDEETELFSLIEETCSTQELESLASQIEEAREAFLPSRAA